MRESKFVEQNKDKWQHFEDELRRHSKDPQALRRQMTEISEDLSFARTFYHNRSVRVYLNGLAQTIYGRIYKSRKNMLSSMQLFFTRAVPGIVYHSRKDFLLVFLLLLLSVAIGLFSSWKDEGFARSVLGDTYVNQTLENIKNGEPMGVYKNRDQWEMFFSIGFNNLKVALLIFLSGIVFSYGALVIMMRNGIMLGAFMYFFYSRSLGSEFNLSVWMHGGIEIFSLMVETLAGLLLGRGLVNPGTYSRLKAFSIWGRRGAMLFLATVPFIVFAAFIESFLTRYTGMPDVLRLFLILISLTVMLLYFVYLPYYLYGGTEDTSPGTPETTADPEPTFATGQIPDTTQILVHSVNVFFKSNNRFMRQMFLLCLLYTIALLVLFPETITDRWLPRGNLLGGMGENGASILAVFAQIRDNISGLLKPDSAEKYLMLGLFLGFAIGFTMLQFVCVIGITASKRRVYAISLSAAMLWNTLLQTGSGLQFAMYILAAPLVLSLSAFAVFKSRQNNLLRFLSEFLLRFSSGAAFLLLFSALVFAFGLLLLYSPFAQLLLWLFEMHADIGNKTYLIVLNTLNVFSLLFLSAVCLSFTGLQAIFLTFAANEAATAEGMKSDIEKMGQNKKMYGIETE